GVGSAAAARSTQGSSHPSPGAARRNADSDRPALWRVGAAHITVQWDSPATLSTSRNNLAHTDGVTVNRRQRIVLIQLKAEPQLRARPCHIQAKFPRAS